MLFVSFIFSSKCVRVCVRACVFELKYSELPHCDCRIIYTFVLSVHWHIVWKCEAKPKRPRSALGNWFTYVWILKVKFNERNKAKWSAFTHAHAHKRSWEKESEIKKKKWNICNYVRCTLSSFSLSRHTVFSVWLLSIFDQIMCKSHNNDQNIRLFICNKHNISFLVGWSVDIMPLLLLLWLFLLLFFFNSFLFCR